MYLRVGKVTNAYASEGKVKVMYEDTNSSSLPLPMLTMNNEYSMPSVGDRVITVHMANGSSKGFVLGTYYGGSKEPKATSGYRKDFGGGAYASCKRGEYTLYANKIILKTTNGEINVGDLMNQLENLENLESSYNDLLERFNSLETSYSDLLERLETIEGSLGITTE